MFTRYPDLVKKLKLKTKRNYAFPSSMDPLEIPPVTAKWCLNEEYFPKASQNMLYVYFSQKIQGSQGQQEKAFRVLQNRKILYAKTFLDENDIYVKAMIQKVIWN